jgi:hypothetical protein
MPTKQVVLPHGSAEHAASHATHGADGHLNGPDGRDALGLSHSFEELVGLLIAVHV